MAHFDKNRRRREKGNVTTKLTRQEVAVFTPASNDRIPHAAVRHDDKTRPKNLVTFWGILFFGFFERSQSLLIPQSRSKKGKFFTKQKTNNTTAVVAGIFAGARVI